MYLLDECIECKSRSDRVEIFFFYDCHIGKRNCAESAIIKQRREILRRADMPNRYVRILMGGDINDVIKPGDVRFDFNEVADWLLEGSATTIREKLNDVAKAQIDRSVKLFDPLRNLVLGNIEANHDRAVRKRYNSDTQSDFCKELGVRSLTDEAIIRFRFQRKIRGARGAAATVKVYLRHGYGSGRTPGAEPNKIVRMMQDGITADCDICMTGHTHTYHPGIVEPVHYIPNAGRLPKQLLTRYRFGANPGCWLLSHKVGVGGYES